MLSGENLNKAIFSNTEQVTLKVTVSELAISASPEYLEMQIPGQHQNPTKQKTMEGTGKSV